MAHREADLAVARAAAAEAVPMIFSNQASVPMERCAEAMGSSPRWFQLYWSTSNELVESLVGRAEACGCEAIVVTLDTTLLGWRTRDLDLAYLPFLRGKGIAQYTSDPVFLRLVDQDERPMERQRPTLSALSALYQLTRAYPGSFLANLRSPRPRTAVRRFLEIYSRPSLTWNDLPFLRERTKLPILLKGVLHPDDARRAVDEGIDGLVVSNHGGRQIDGEIATRWSESGAEDLGQLRRVDVPAGDDADDLAVASGSGSRERQRRRAGALGDDPRALGEEPDGVGHLVQALRRASRPGAPAPARTSPGTPPASRSRRRSSACTRPAPAARPRATERAERPSRPRPRRPCRTGRPRAVPRRSRTRARRLRRAR